jgi:mRNA interferase YafQ
LREIITTTAFRKDVKRMRKRGKDLAKLEDVVERLMKDLELEPRHKPHPLIGNWKPLWDLHIEPDWVLIYQLSDTEVYLARMGSHADIFD